MTIFGFDFFKSPEVLPAKKEKMSGFRPTVLAVLDGFGVPQDRFAPYYAAKRPNFELLEKFFPYASLQASGIAVGLPWGQEGNSEVGHLTIGSGKILYHHLPRIVVAIQDGSFFQNPSFKRAAEIAKKNSSRFHVMGLFSSGSVHAYPDHLYALLDFVKAEGTPRVFLHLFTDGRDAPLRESATFLRELETRIQSRYPFARIASLIGRSYAMDRDGDWNKIEKAYRLLTEGTGNGYEHASEYAAREHGAGRTDEFIEPGFLQDETGGALGRIQPGDAVIFFNFRED
ncbi:MAG: 2,3-bisphosphoglycerate-independent phosphoglycerate mutase, partial [Patescibacteria group bacterium]